jgi:hypothetical protein
MVLEHPFVLRSLRATAGPRRTQEP